MSILLEPIWFDLRPYIRLEVYDRDGGASHPRYRIEVITPSDGVLLRRFLATTMPCVVCGRRINPIRARQGKSNHLYFAATCELAVNYACARSADAREEYDAIKRHILQWREGQCELQEPRFTWD